MSGIGLCPTGGRSRHGWGGLTDGGNSDALIGPAPSCAPLATPRSISGIANKPPTAAPASCPPSNQDTPAGKYAPLTAPGTALTPPLTPPQAARPLVVNDPQGVGESGVPTAARALPYAWENG